MAATSTPLASVDDLAAYLQQDVAADSPQAAYYLNLASALVRGYLRSDFSFVADDVVVLDPTDGCPYVILPGYPIQSVSLVETLDVTTGVWSDVTPYVFASTTTGIVSPRGWTGLSWPVFPGSWRVTYSHGWQDVPADVAAVVAQLAGDAYASSAGVAQETIGGYSVRYIGASGSSSASGLSPAVEAVLAPYRRPVIA